MILLIVFFFVCLGLLLWDSSGEFDLVSGFVLVLLVVTATRELRRRRTAASRWADRGPAAQRRPRSDFLWGTAIILTLLSVPLAGWYQFPQTPPLILFVVLIVAVGVRELDLAGRRASAIQGWCFEQGYRFYERGYSQLRCQFGGAGLPRWGANAAPAVVGQYEGRSFLAFAYYQEDEDNRYERGTVVAVFSDRRLPAVDIYKRDPEESRTDGAQLELAAFNQAFRVETKDPRRAFEILGQESMERLLGGPRFDEIHLREDALIVLHKTSLHVEGIEAALDLAHFLLRRIPACAAQSFGR